MKKTTILTCVVLAFCTLNAQDFVVPANYILKVDSDYKKYEKDIIACANWLENTPLNVDEQKRIEANKFLMQWLTGSPTVTINLDAGIIVNCTDKNPDFLILFMAGWTRFSLENNYSNDQQKAYLEGLKSIINVYKKDISINKDKDMDKMVKIYDNGELEDWVKNNIK